MALFENWVLLREDGRVKPCSIHDSRRIGLLIGPEEREYFETHPGAIMGCAISRWLDVSGKEVTVITHIFGQKPLYRS